MFSVLEKSLNKFFSVYKNLCLYMKKLFFVFLLAFMPSTLLKRDSNTCVLVNIAKFLRAPILESFWQRLLLHFWKVFPKNLFSANIYILIIQTVFRL